MRQGAVLARVLGRELIDEASWGRWHTGRDEKGKVAKSLGPLAVRQRQVIRLFRLKGGKKGKKSKKNTQNPIKRTVFSAPRDRHLSGGGSTWGRVEV